MEMISVENHEKESLMAEVQAKLSVAEAQQKAGSGRSLRDILIGTKEKYAL